MKKIILIVLFFVSVQTIFAKLNFGVKAGYNSSLTFSNMSDYDLSSAKSEIWHNFQIGPFLRLSGKKFYFQPELLYSINKKNYNVTLQDAANKDVTVNKFATTSTVDVPLLVGAKLLDLKILNVRAFMGPNFRFNAGSSLEFKNLTGGNFNTTDLSKDIKKAQIGLEMGAGVDVLMLTLDFRYNLIGNMYDTKIKDISLKDLPASTFVISLGWKIF